MRFSSIVILWTIVTAIALAAWAYSIHAAKSIDESFVTDVRTFSIGHPATGCLYTGYAKVDPGVRFEADVATLVVEGRAQFIGALPRDPACGAYQ